MGIYFDSIQNYPNDFDKTFFHHSSIDEIEKIYDRSLILRVDEKDGNILRFSELDRLFLPKKNNFEFHSKKFLKTKKVYRPQMVPEDLDINAVTEEEYQFHHFSPLPKKKTMKTKRKTGKRNKYY